METRTDGGDGHLDLLRIDAVRSGEGSAREMAHLQACARCRGDVERLGEAARLLRGGRAAEVDVPSRVDRAVLEAYRRRQGRLSRVPVRAARPWLRTAAAGMAAAAALTLGLALPLWRSGPPELRVPPAEAPRTASGSAPTTPTGPDLNRDGRTDILDAFLLARSLRAGADGPAAWDGNGDGRTDAADVDVLGRMAVAL